MGFTNIGNQNITFSFNEKGVSSSFNKLYYKIIKPGIYDGGDISKKNTTTVTIAPFVAYIEDNNNLLGVRISTSLPVDLTVTESEPYIIVRFIWKEEEHNYADIITVDESSIFGDDIIIGRAVFNDGILQSTFDYTRRTKGEISRSNLQTDVEGDDSEAQTTEESNNTEAYFYVAAKEPISNKVLIQKGFLVKQSGEIIYNAQQDSPTFSDTVDGRIDLLYINSDGDFQILEGTDSSSPTIPNFIGNEGNFVIAKITRIGNHSTITGNQIKNYDITKVIRLNTINAYQIEGKDVGNDNGNISLSNGIVNTNLNVQYIDGAEKSEEENLISDSDNLIPTTQGIAGRVGGGGEQWIDIGHTHLSNIWNKRLTSGRNSSFYHPGANDNTNNPEYQYLSGDVQKDEVGNFAIGNYFYVVSRSDWTYVNVCFYTGFYGGRVTQLFSGTSTDGYGKALAIQDRWWYSEDKNFVMVGAPDASTSTGKVYIYGLNGFVPPVIWGDEEVINGKATGQEFGYSVDISHDSQYIVIGAPGDSDNGADAGAIYIYRHQGSNLWQEETKIKPIDGAAGDRFGESVKIHTNYIVVGAPNHNSNGAVYVFKNTGVSTWDSGTKIIGTGISAGDDFGKEIALTEGNIDYIAVGVWKDDTEATDAGSVFIYLRTDTNSWGQETKLYPEVNTSNVKFGYSIDLNNKWLFVGMPNYNVAAGELAYPFSGGNGGKVVPFYRVGQNEWKRLPWMWGQPSAWSPIDYGRKVLISENFIGVGGDTVSIPGDLLSILQKPK